MTPTPRPCRTSALGALTSLALAASALGITSAADGAVTPDEEFFAPRLVTVDTSTRGEKDRLQQLGLDLAEHAGHGYVEAVLHTEADLAALDVAGFDPRRPDPGPDCAWHRDRREQRDVRRVGRRFAPALGPHRLPDPRRLHRRRRCWPRRTAAWRRSSSSSGPASTAGRSTASRSARACASPTAVSRPSC